MAVHSQRRKSASKAKAATVVLVLCLVVLALYQSTSQAPQEKERGQAQAKQEWWLDNYVVEHLISTDSDWPVKVYKQYEAPKTPSLWARAAAWLSAEQQGLRGCNLYVADRQGYERMRRQYATGSVPDTQMTPGMIVDAATEQCIQSTLAYAKKHKQAIAIRTGGHHYQGASSCGRSNIQLRISAFDKFEYEEQSNELRVGASWQLLPLLSELHRHGIALPAGICPNVAIGGHVLSGGFGLAIPSFGAVVDHLIGFRIVMADGSVKQMKRPAKGEKSEDAELWYAVLGGSPGAFGVVTEYVFEPLRDRDYAGTMAGIFFWQFSEERHRTLVSEIVKMAEDGGDWMPQELGIFVNTFSKGHGGEMGVKAWSLSGTLKYELPFATIVLMVQWSQLKQGAAELKRRDAWMKRINELVAQIGPPVLPGFGDRMAASSVSAAALTWTMIAPREYDFPYMKRFYHSRRKLTGSGYPDQLSKLLAEAVNDQQASNGIHAVSEFLIAGAHLTQFGQGDDGRTCHPWRKQIFYQNSFDVFYDADADVAGEQAKKRAEAQALIDQADKLHLSQVFAGAKDGVPVRQLAYSWGGVDIERDWSSYYAGRRDVYERLRKVKKRVDPDNIFTASKMNIKA